MNKNVRAVLKVVGLFYLGCALLAAIIIPLFNKIQKFESEDPYNKVCVPYICEDTNISEEYGDILRAGQRTGKIKIEGDVIYVPYVVHVHGYKIFICVTVNSKKEENGEIIYTPVSYEIQEVRND